MVSLAWMLDHNKFSLLGSCTSRVTEGRTEPTAMLAVPECPLPAANVVSTKGTPHPSAGAVAESPAAPRGGSRRAFLLRASVCLCVFFPWQNEIKSFLAHLPGREGAPSRQCHERLVTL